MDNELLERAKRLQAAAGDMVNLHKSIRVADNVSGSYSPGRSSPTRILSKSVEEPSAETLRGSVIKGSSLMTTFQDIRHKCPRGASIDIDGVRCTVSSKGEYSANQIALAEDYKGESNFDCIINIAAGAAGEGKVRTRTRAVAPVPSSEIQDAIRNLGEIDMIKTQMAQKAAFQKEMPFQKGAPGRAQSLLRRMQYRPSQSGADDASYTPSQKQSKFKSRLPMAVRQALVFNELDGSNRATSAPSREESVTQQQKQHASSSSNSSVVSKSNVITGATYRGSSEPAYRYEHEEQVLHLGSRDVARERDKALQRVAQKLREDRDRIVQLEQEEHRKREAARERSERKTNILMRKTIERVEERKQRLAEEQLRRTEQEQQEQLRRARAEELAASSAYSAKLQQIKQQTRQRLRGLQVLDKQMQAESEAEAQRRLNAYTRLRSIPTKVLLGNHSASELPLLPPRLPRAQGDTTGSATRYGAAGQQALDEDSVEEPWLQAASLRISAVAAVAVETCTGDDSISVDSMEQSPGKLAVSAEAAYYLQDRPQSPLSDMTNLSPLNERREKKKDKKEKKFKPWKLKPIPLSLPYIQVPAQNNSEFIV